MDDLIVRGAGAAQLAIVVASLAVPLVLRWREDTAKLTPLTRQVFWIYAGYILGAHVAFGGVSLCHPRWLNDGTPLARAVAGFIATWWGARLALQFLVMDRSARPPGRWAELAEALLVTAFTALAAIYAWVALR